jgi:5-methyltetrahydropteroyltriglutamate--homocysteine methyltransferase
VAIPTEAIGSIPRTPELVEAMDAAARGEITSAELLRVREHAVRDTLRELAATGSPVIGDGEQSQPGFLSYALDGLDNVRGAAAPRLTAGPFRYGAHAGQYVRTARLHTELPIKQSVIAGSALSLIYPTEPIPDYPRGDFLLDLVTAAEADLRGCLEGGAYRVQLDWRDGLVRPGDAAGTDLLDRFVAIDNSVLDRFTRDEQDRIGVHVAPGAGHAGYLELLPHLLQLDVRRFYLHMGGDDCRAEILATVAEFCRMDQEIFVGVVDPDDTRVETPEEICERLLEAAEYIPRARLGSCDDRGFAPLAEDQRRARETAFAKIAARVEGTRMASERLGL